MRVIFTILAVVCLLVLMTMVVGTKYWPGKYQVLTFWSGVAAFVATFVCIGYATQGGHGWGTFPAVGGITFAAIAAGYIVVLLLPEPH